MTARQHSDWTRVILDALLAVRAAGAGAGRPVLTDNELDLLVAVSWMIRHRAGELAEDGGSFAPLAVALVCDVARRLSSP